MKIGLFADAHYCHTEVLCGTRRPSLSLSKIREAMNVFREANVDICICLGDLTDHAPEDTKKDVSACFNEALEVIRSYEIPFYFVPGNHDYLMMTAEELEKARIKIPPYTISADGYRLIILDANYRSDGRRFDVAGVEWTDSNLPQGQVDFLRRELENANEDCIVCIHENLDPFVEMHHIIKNAEETREIIQKSGKVKLVLQGHYHPGAERMIDDVTYITLSAMCEGMDNSYRILTLP